MSSSDDPEEVELHPQYDVAAHIDELFSVPVYRNPESSLMESWRALGERLLALGDRHLLEGIDAGTEFLQSKLDARRRRRERQAAKRRAARAAREAAAAAATAAAAAAAATATAAQSAADPRHGAPGAAPAP